MADEQGTPKETFGGTEKDQTDVMNRALRNQNRFETDRAPRGHEGLGGIEADKAKG